MNKIIKKSLSAFLVGVITVMSLSAAAFAEPNEKNVTFALDCTNGFDTISFTQDDYLKSAYSMSRAADDENQVGNICASFIASSRAGVRRPNLYRSMDFISKDCVQNSTIQYRLSEFDYLSELYKDLDWEILRDNIDFDNIQATIDGNVATVNVVENYTYQINGFDNESFRKREYIFTLNKNDYLWQVTDVVTNDPWEDDDFTYQSIDVNAALETLHKNNVVDCTDDSTEIPEPLNASATMYKWNYSVSGAIEYAKKYAPSYNPTFGFTADNDCQNFASQCVWAGLGGENSNGTTSLPALSKNRVGQNAYNVWCRNQNSTYYSSNDYEFNWAWDNVKGFAKLITVNNPSKGEGPFGTMNYTNAIKYAEPGNVLYFARNETARIDNLAHAMFVVEVRGTSGQRTRNNVTIVAHTNPTNSAGQTVAEYCPYSDNCFASANIICGYYSELR